MNLDEFITSLNITPGMLWVMLLLFLSLIEITPIKLNPWSSMARWLGSKMNHQSLVKINELGGQITALDNKITAVSDNVDTLDKKINKIQAELRETENKEDERAAIDARLRILIFCDELQEGHKHSKDRYDQVMQDITFYNKYCVEHPEFKNNQTESTVRYIEKKYQSCLDNHDFLSF